MSEQELRLIEGIARRVENLEILEGVQDNSDLDFAIPAVTVGAAYAEGALDTLIRSDAVLQAGVPVNIGVANAAGAATDFVRRDHVHNHPAALGAALHQNEVTLGANLAANLLGIAAQALSLDTQAANIVFAGPAAGGAVAPTFRALVAADLPVIGSHWTRDVGNAEVYPTNIGDQVGIGIVNPRVMLQVNDDATFDPTPNSDTVELFLYDVSAGAGAGNFGAAIGFTGSGRGLVEAAIVAYQSNDDLDETGLLFYVHESTDEANDMAEAMRIEHDREIGINYAAAPAGQVDIAQDNETAAKPVLVLRQDDISEGFINFIGSDRGVITGATNSLESVRVERGGTIYRIALYVDA